VLLAFIPASLLKRFDLHGKIPHFKVKLPAKSSSDAGTPSFRVYETG
jgi:hypothetical protein